MRFKQMIERSATSMGLQATETQPVGRLFGPDPSHGIHMDR
jgi:hypothetical protein